jgi:hypothetical protein
MTTDPVCPKCGGAMWDNRASKTKTTQPDYKCKDKACDGVIWPPKDAPAPEQTRQLARQSEGVLAQVTMDPRLLMAAKAIQLMSGKNEDGTPKISDEMAIAAALYQAGTGQLVGRDFYVNDKVGRMEGYRGVARDASDRGAGELELRYRPLTAAENAEHEIEPGDIAYACEVYQLRAWRVAQRMSVEARTPCTYQPITGIGVVREIEKYDRKSTQKWLESEKRSERQPKAQWRKLDLEGGMTWAKKARNRAYKDALRHVPGAPATVDEVLEEGALQGVERPEMGARLNMDQAQEWVKQGIQAQVSTPSTNAPPPADDSHDAELFEEGDYAPETPATDALLVQIINRLVEQSKINCEPADAKLIKTANGHLSCLCRGDDAQRHALLATLFGLKTSKDLTIGQAETLVAWIAAKPTTRDAQGKGRDYAPSGPAQTAGEYAMLCTLFTA